MIAFFAGAFVGAGVMLLVMSLCVIAADADRREERMVREDEKRIQKRCGCVQLVYKMQIDENVN